MEKTIRARRPKEIMLLSLSLGTAIGILPFTVYRFTVGDWAVGLLDLVILVFMLALFVFVFQTRNVRIAAIILIMVAIGGNIFSFYLKGINQIFWIYPAMLSAYYLLRPIQAVYINGFLLLLYMPKLFNVSNTVEFSTILVTILVTNLIAYVFASSLKKQQSKLKKIATRDYLTQTGNRRLLDEKLVELIKALNNEHGIASIILLDLDNFKLINDKYGHLLGDKALVQLAEILNSNSDLNCVFRYGGEEFIIICNNCTTEQAALLAEKIRCIVEIDGLISESKLTISLGVSQYIHGELVEDWIHRVDTALYNAKHKGKNTVVTI
jgi:diguanylate cyclase (GGDEF)-like protein